MRIFVDAKKDKYGGFYTALSKRHNRILRKYCDASESQAIYSLRHNFEDACRVCEHRREMLALQLHFLFEMGAARFGLMGAPPE
ncbi:MAG: hypothetical protein ABSC37_14800 [Xanthobacteraceae bacterium]